MRGDDLGLKPWCLDGWQTYKNNLGAIFPIAGIFFIYSMFLLLLLHLPHGFLIANVISLVLWPGWMGGYIFFSLMLIRGETANWRIFMAGFSNFWKVWLTYFLIMVVTVIGLFLLVIPGMVWFVQYGFGVIGVLDKKLSPLQALRFSITITYGYRWKLFLLFVVIMGIVISFWMLIIVLSASMGGIYIRLFKDILARLGAYSLYFFVVLPIAFLVVAAAYNNLNKRYQNAAQIVEPTE